MADKIKFDPKRTELYKHAVRELNIAGITKEDSDLSGAIQDCVLKLVAHFIKQRHSEQSGELVKQIFIQLVSHEILTPLTDNPDEWESVSKEFGTPMWQSLRSPAYFSKDGGKTWFHAKTNKIGTSVKHDEAKKTTK